MLVVVVVLVIGTSTYVALRFFLDSQFDKQLQQTSAQNTGFFDRCLDNAVQVNPDKYRCLSGPQTQQEWVLAYDKTLDQAFTFSSDYGTDLKPLQLSDTQLRTLVQDPNQTIAVRQDGVDLRVTADMDRAEQRVVATGLSTSAVERTLRRLIAIEIVIGAVAVLIAVVFTSYGVRFGLRRLRRVTSTAQEVAAELSPEGAGLGLRVPDDEPDTEVGQLATSFNMMLAAVQTQFAARLESENRMRQFMADASHELRTPLTSIRGYAELARMQRAAGDASDDNLHRIESEGTRMSRLVEDLLTLARGETNGAERPLRQELIDVAEVIDDAVSSSRAAFPGRQLDVRVAGDLHVIGDPDQLLRVVRNLITNSAIHTLPERPIGVHGFADPSGVTIQVLDGGPGLAPDEAAHVFERFWRADKARTRARGGSGLGLSIVATIVRAHGGTVRFESSVDTGSTVTVTLPGAHSDQD